MFDVRNLVMFAATPAHLSNRGNYNLSCANRTRSNKNGGLRMLSQHAWHAGRFNVSDAITTMLSFIQEAIDLKILNMQVRINNNNRINK